VKQYSTLFLITIWKLRFQKEKENPLLNDTKRKDRKDKGTLEISFEDPKSFQFILDRFCGGIPNNGSTCDL